VTFLLGAAAVTLVAVLLAAGTWLSFGWLGAWRLNRTPSSRISPEFTFTPWELDVAHETVRFETADGIGLHGWFLPRPDERRAVVAMHGYRGEKSDVLGISSMLWRAGFNVLLFDFRGRGRSDPAPISMGLWELDDLSTALDWISRRIPGGAIGLFGFSMGAAVALMGGADARVRAIVADSAFPSQRAVLEHVAARDVRRALGGWLDGRRFLPGVERWHRRRGKPPFDAIRPIDSLPALAGTPLLFVHGTRDGWIPLELADRLYAAAPEPRERWIVEGAYHCGAYFVDREAYIRRVGGFLARSLDGAP